jgi:hypothetical protein
MQPKIYAIEPFNASTGTTIKYSWSGDIGHYNTCVIKDAITMEVVYEHTNQTFKLEHTLVMSAFTTPLHNDHRYIAYITVLNRSQEAISEQSAGVIFLCLEKPEFLFLNVQNHDTLESPTYEFTLKYNHPTGEKLDSWKMTVYDSGNIELTTSNVRYDVTEVYDRATGDFMYYTASYTVSGFTNGRSYRIHADGKTINGMTISADVSFSVFYDVAAVFSMLETVNLPETGCVLVTSNIISADGRPEYIPVTYFNGTYVNMLNNSVTYDEGFLLDGNFSYVMYACQIMPNMPICEFKSAENPKFKAHIVYREGYLGTTEYVGQFEFYATTGITEYVIYTPTFEVLKENTVMGICLIRQNGLYGLYVERLGEFVYQSSNEVMPAEVE